jgi:hypothetical protein
LSHVGAVQHPKVENKKLVPGTMMNQTLGTGKMHEELEKIFTKSTPPSLESAIVSIEGVVDTFMWDGGVVPSDASHRHQVSVGILKERATKGFKDFKGTIAGVLRPK